MSRVCKTCKKEKSSEHFCAYHGSPDTLRPHCIECQKAHRQTRDWQGWRKGWPYKGDIRDAEYLKDRRKLFNESGNGWWWGQSGK